VDTNSGRYKDELINYWQIQLFIFLTFYILCCICISGWLIYAVLYLYVLVFVIIWRSLAQESWNMLEINYRLLGFLPKKVHFVHFCLISVVEHTVFTEEYVFLNCIHTGNMSRCNFRNLSRLITTTDNGQFQVH
jgi:hypothetical protein